MKYCAIIFRNISSTSFKYDQVTWQADALPYMSYFSIVILYVYLDALSIGPTYRIQKYILLCVILENNKNISPSENIACHHTWRGLSVIFIFVCCFPVTERRPGSVWLLLIWFSIVVTWPSQEHFISSTIENGHMNGLCGQSAWCDAIFCIRNASSQPDSRNVQGSLILLAKFSKAKHLAFENGCLQVGQFYSFCSGSFGWCLF
jgi:hypothetical protein